MKLTSDGWKLSQLYNSQIPSFWLVVAPVTLNEPRVMALRRIDIHRVQHLRCKVQHPSKMTKQCRTTFRNECMDLKHCSTMVHHSPAMVNHRPATGIPFYRKNPRDEKTKGKKLPWPDWGSDRIFWVWNLPVTAESGHSCRTHRYVRFDWLSLP